MKNRILSFCFRLLGIAALIAGVYLVVGSIQNYIAQHDQMDWTVQTAEVSDISSRIVSRGAGSQRRSRTVYDIIYQYEVDGQTYTGDITGTSTIRMVGDTLKIKYDPEVPENSTTTLSPQLSDLLIPMGAGIVFAVLGFFISGLYAWIHKMRRRWMPEEEEILPPEEYIDPMEERKPPQGPVVVILQRVMPLLFVISMIIMVSGIFSGRDAVTPTKFADTMEAHGYITVDSTDRLRQEWKIGSMLKQAVSLETGEIRMDFCVMDTLSTARSLYHGMELPVSEGEEYDDSGRNHEIYAIEGEELYSAKLRVGDTVIYAACTPEYRTVMLELLESIGYLEDGQEILSSAE